MIDYYELLGVSRSASADEIKRAYRRKARQLHPDVNETGDEEQFKMITRAYEVLGDEENRRSYDMGVDPTAPRGEGGFSGFGGFNGGGFGGSAFPSGAFGFQDLFETLFNGGAAGHSSRNPIPRVQEGDDTLLRLNISLEDAIFGAKREVEVDTAVLCPLCHGYGAQPGTEVHECHTCRGTGHVQRVQRSFLGQVLTTALCPECEGHGDIIEDPCTRCHGGGRIRERHTITVNIPAGVTDRTRIRVSGQGDVGPGGGPAGDLYLEIKIEPNTRFTRNGDNLLAEIEISMAAAALGTSYLMDTFDGPQQIVIEPGTQSGDVVKLPGLGFGRLRGNGRGDLLVSVRVMVPRNLTEHQKELLQQFAADRGEERLPLPEPAAKKSQRRRPNLLNKKKQPGRKKK